MSFSMLPQQNLPHKMLGNDDFLDNIENYWEINYFAITTLLISLWPDLCSRHVREMDGTFE